LLARWLEPVRKRLRGIAGNLTPFRSHAKAVPARNPRSLLRLSV
jgi:hypothetical protein